MMKTIGILIIVLLFTSYNFAQKSSLARIKTSAKCGMCKDRIEEKLNYTKGIKFAELDIDKKELLVKFKNNRISKAQILSLVSELGYHADKVRRNEEAHNKLPNCCKTSNAKKVTKCCSSSKKSCSKK